MQSYINPQAYNVQNPKGVDFAISKVQTKLLALPFLDVVYGRAYIQYAESPADKTKDPPTRRQTVYFPETWGKNYEPVNVMPNGNLKGYCFFVVRDPGRQDNQTNVLPSQISVKQPISIIFWGDLKKIDNTKAYRYSEELKRLLLFQVTRCANFTFDAVYESYGKVFEGFTLTETYTKYLKPPYYAVRIDGFLNFDILPQCGELDDTPTNIPIPPQYPTIEDYLPYRVDLRVGVDTNQGATAGQYVFPNEGSLNPENYPINKPNLTLKDLKILTELSLGGSNYQLVPFTPDGLGFDFTNSAGVVTDGVITFTVRKKLL